MVRLVLSAASLFLMSLCSCKQSKVKATAYDSLVNMQNSPSGEAYRKGARLVAANDCITCHSVDKRVVGPSFKEIASKYHNDQKYVDFLTNTVVRGSKGAWGEQEMTPHPQVRITDINEMVSYILSVK